MNVSSRDLRAFLALATERNFTRAAAACHLSQPAFSALVRQLEDSLGVRLFDRSTRHVELSQEGVEFERSARRVLGELDALVLGMRERAARERGRVSIALLPSLAADWLPPVLAGFHAAHPGIEIDVADVLSEPCIERVRGGRFDFALAATRAETPELRAEPFCSDSFHLVCPTGHPLSQLRDPRPRDVTAWPFIHLSRTSSVRQYLDAATHPQPLRSILEVDQLATVAGMVRAGLGVSIVPALTLYQFRSAELDIRPLRWPGLNRRIYLVRRRDRGLSPAAQGLYDWVMAHRPQKEQPTRRG
ncbi:LysR family transcriptional regulator [Hylemonella gracilis]|uniref:LysR family transcriptional regulator n=1 Tax=Hylemonella gracilis ATCC 19624 TaxID=887062 RepID=F3KXD8_9BURK|nr:LysR family transcriptional regulator [Hylemonella gracilis]EGI75505.1 LysR family transcriptional regulator [Hylemonella gracilis ATCC 19624]